VLDDLGGRLGRVWREMNEEATDYQTVIRDLLEGQFSDPVRLSHSTPRKDGHATSPTM
jgi:hypothetical protein